MFKEKQNKAKQPSPNVALLYLTLGFVKSRILGPFTNRKACCVFYFLVKAFPFLVCIKHILCIFSETHSIWSPILFLHILFPFHFSPTTLHLVILLQFNDPKGRVGKATQKWKEKKNQGSEYYNASDY